MKRTFRPITRLLGGWMQGLAVCMVVGSFGLVEPCSATYLVFTTDVCRTWGTDVNGQWEGTDYGLPLVIEKLDRWGIKGSFFVSPFVPEGHEEEASATIRYILSKGHDVQLHPHADTFGQERDRLTDYNKEEKRRILERGIKLLVQAGAPRPVAHRAGAYAIDVEMLNLLPEVNIFIDSSIFPIDPRCKVSLPEDLINRFVRIDGLYQLPITFVRRVPFIGFQGMTALDINRMIWEELQTALEQIAEHRMPVATFFMHYFSLYRRLFTGEYLAPLTVLGPDEDKIETLDKVLRMVSADKRFRIVTVSELWNIHASSPQELQGPSFVPYTGLWLMYRKAWHDIGGNLPNKIVALGPIIIVGIFVAVLLIIRRNRRSSAKHEPRPGMTG